MLRGEGLKWGRGMSAEVVRTARVSIDAFPQRESYGPRQMRAIYMQCTWTSGKDVEAQRTLLPCTRTKFPRCGRMGCPCRAEQWLGPVCLLSSMVHGPCFVSPLCLRLPVSHCPSLHLPRLLFLLCSSCHIHPLKDQFIAILRTSISMTLAR